LYIADTATAHYLVLACGGGSAYGGASKQLIVWSGQLKVYTGLWNMGVIYTGTPISDVKKQEIRELEAGVEVGVGDQRDYVGGKAFEFDPKVRIFLKKTGNTTREAVLRKHRDKATGITAKFQITDRGVEDV
jgi:hypothetical protein